MSNWSKGFSLVEILVAVSILVILAAITLVAYDRVKERSSAAAWAQQLGEVETALKTYRQFELPNGWPAVSGTQGDIPLIVSGNSSAFPNFEQYFTGPTNLPNNLFSYTYDGSTFYTCNTSVANYERSGVNIHIEGASSRMLDLLNEIIDGDSPVTGCGKFRIDAGGQGYYNISSSTFSY